MSKHSVRDWAENARVATAAPDLLEVLTGHASPHLWGIRVVELLLQEFKRTSAALQELRRMSGDQTQEESEQILHLVGDVEIFCKKARAAIRKALGPQT